MEKVICFARECACASAHAVALASAVISTVLPLVDIGLICWKKSRIFPGVLARSNGEKVATRSQFYGIIALKFLAIVPWLTFVAEDLPQYVLFGIYLSTVGGGTIEATVVISTAISILTVGAFVTACIYSRKSRTYRANKYRIPRRMPRKSLWLTNTRKPKAAKRNTVDSPASISQQRTNSEPEPNPALNAEPEFTSDRGDTT